MTIFAVFADAAAIIQWFIVSASTLCVFISHHFQTTGIDITSNPASWIVLVLYTVEGVFYSSGEEEKFTYFVSVYWQFSWGVGGFLLLNLPLLGCCFLLNLSLTVKRSCLCWAKLQVEQSEKFVPVIMLLRSQGPVRSFLTRDQKDHDCHFHWKTSALSKSLKLFKVKLALVITIRAWVFIHSSNYLRDQGIIIVIYTTEKIILIYGWM